MTLQFNISVLALTLAEGGAYSFTLTPKGPLSAAMDIRWVIVPKGKIPITTNDFSAFEGTESFASGATAGKTITITPTDDALAEVSGEFEIQVYQVVSGGDILIGSQDVVLTDDEASSGTLLNRLPGNSNVNNFFLGSSSPLKSEGGNGDDVYVISRYQTGDVTLSDGFDSNTIKFDYGVEIASVVRGGFFGEGDAELTLGTGGVVTWKFPNLDTNWKYQIGDGDALDWTEFLTAIGLSGSTGTLSTPYTVDSLATDSVTAGNIASRLSGTGADEVFSLGVDGYLKSEGGNGDDVYIITRYQKGDVTLSDGFGANILKFDYGVEIASVIRGGFFGEGDAELTLGTGGIVTWKFPNLDTNWQYQIADGAVLTWTEFLTALGLGSSGGTLSTPYTVEDPPGKIITSDATGAALPENTEVSTSTAVYTAVGASDAGAIVWTLKAGADAGLFNINSSTGVVTFIAATTPDHEDKSSYSFTIIATAGTETDELLVTIAVTDLNDTSPVFTSATTATLTEGTEVATTTAVYTATATPDVDGDTIVWSLSGDDADSFNIDPLTGKVTFKTATTPDFESGKTSYRFNVIATVGTGNTAQMATQAVTLSVPNVNDAPIISTNGGSALSLNVLEGTSIQTPIAKIVASDGDGDSLSYSLSGADAADFSIDANGLIKFVAVPSLATPADSDTDNVYNIVVTVSDGTGAGALSDTIALAINVVTATGATAPTISSGATGTFAENTPFDTTTPIYTATGSAGSVINWSLKAGGDAALFNIDPITGEVTFKAATTPDFEADSSYSFTIVATVGSHTTEQAVTISITDAEDPPVLAGELSGEVKEAGVEPAEATISFNAHGLIFTFKDIDDVTDSFDKLTLGEILGGTVKHFQFVNTGSEVTSIVGDTWQIWLDISNFSHTYNDLVNYLTNDGSGGYGDYGVNDFYTLSLATDITGAGALPSSWRDKIALSLKTASSGLVAAPGTPMATGQLSVADEDVADAGGFAATDLTLQTRADSDSAWTTANTDNANGGKGLKIIGTYGALYIKSDGSWSYELDNDDADTQALTPDDAVDETFELRVADGTDAPSETKILTITVQGANDAALSASASGVTITNGVGAISVREDTQTSNVTTITVSNPDGTALTYSLLGADAGSFTFDEDTGILSFKTIPDYEFPTDTGKDNVYNVTVNIDDGIFAQNIVLEVTVTNVGTLVSPTITSGEGGSIEENLQYTTNDPIYVAEGTSGSHERIAWSLKQNNSDDAALFDIDLFTGRVTFKTATTLDYESDPFIGSTANDTTPEFRFTIVATVDSGALAQSTSKNITIKLENLNDAPVITDGDGTDDGALAISVAENTTAVTDIAATDADADALTYSLSGADAALFNINASGALSFKSAPDFETPTDADGDNNYEVTVHVADGIYDASGDLSDADRRVFEYSGGALSKTTDSDGDRLVSVAAGTITTSDGTTINFAAATGLEVLATSYIIVDDADNNNTYEARLVTALPDGDDFYVLGKTGTGVVSTHASLTVFGIVITADQAGSAGNNTIVFNSASTLNTYITSAGSFVIWYKAGVTTLQQVIDSINSGATGALLTASLAEGASGDSVLVVSGGGRHALSGGVDSSSSDEFTTYDLYSDEIDVTVAVADVDDTPPVISSGDGTIVENVLFTTGSPVYTATGTAVGAIVWSLKVGGDAASFTIDSGTGVVTFVEATTPDYEVKDEYVFTIIATIADARHLTAEQAVTIAVTDVNEALVITDGDGTDDGAFAVSVAENTTAVTDIVATDGDDDALVFSLSGADAALFEISASGVLSFKSAPDYETPTDVGGDNNYDVTVHVTDGFYDASGDVSDADVRTFKYTGGVLSKTTDSDNDRLVSVASGTITKADGTTINFAAATGLEVLATSYIIVDDADEDSTYEARLVTALPAGDDFYVLGKTEIERVGVIHASLTFAGIVITAKQVGKAGEVNIEFRNSVHEINIGVGGDGTPVVRYKSGVTTLQTIINAINSDSDTASLFTASLAAGKSGSDTISNNGGTYKLSIDANDGTEGDFITYDAYRDEIDVTISVTDVSEVPIITTNNGNALAIDVPEDTTAVTDIVATDGDGDALVFSLSGADAALFSINASGALSFISAPDYGDPKDAGKDNDYEVTVHVSDGMTYDASGDASDADTRIFKYSGGALSKSSNSAGNKLIDVASGTITKADGTTINFAAATGLEVLATSYIIVDDGDDDGTYEARLVTALPAGDDFYVLGETELIDTHASVTISEIVLTAKQAGSAGNAGSITILKGGSVGTGVLNDGTPFLRYNEGASTVQQVIAEINASSATSAFVASLADGALGRHLFTGSGGTHRLSGGDTLVGDITTYGLYSDEIDVTVTITNVNDDMVTVTSDGTGAALVENREVDTDTEVYRAVGASDAGTIVWSFKGDGSTDDAGLFDIDSGTGVVTFKAATAPDFEAKGSYAFTVLATVGTLETEKAVTIAVTDVNEAPVITDGDGTDDGAFAVRVAEGTTAVTDIVATADAGDILAFSVSGADAALFNISASGALSFISAPDYDSPADVGGDNVYEVTVHVTDGFYDASGNPSDADLRVFKYTGGAVSKSIDGDGDRLVSVASGTITKADGTTINFAAATGLEVLATSYIIVDDADEDNTYEARLVTALPAGDDFYVLGKTEIEMVVEGLVSTTGYFTIYDAYSDEIDIMVTVTDVL